MNGTDETSDSEGAYLLWGLCPQTPGIFRFDANPQ
jgi:hypothetical protein